MSDLHKVANLHHPSHSKIHAYSTFISNTAKDFNGLQGTKIPSTHQVEIKNKLTVQVSPSTSVASDSLNRGRIEFRLEKGNIDKLISATLRIAVTNSTGANVGLAPSQVLVDKIELYSQNGNKLLTTMYGQELFLNNAFHNKYEFDYLSTGLNLTTSYGYGAVIANATSKVLEIPILTIFKTANLSLSALRNELLVRVYFNDSSLTLVSGSLLTCDNISILLKGYGLPSAVKQQVVDLYNTKPYVIPVKLYQRHTQTLTLAASTGYSIVLSGISGIVSGIFITLRAAAITAANQLTYLQQLDQLDLTESNGTSMIGSYKRTNLDMLSEYADSFSNSMGSNSLFYFINFSSDIVNDVMTGNTNGFHVFNGFQKFTFNTLSTITPGSYVVDIRAICSEHLMIQQGVLNVSR